MAMRQVSNVAGLVRPRAPASMVYDDFSPISEWNEEEQSRVLLVYLPGFRKEQLKVATEGTNNLRIRGERFVGGLKRSRFQEEYQIPTDSTINGIHAKFETGILTITMPKINIFQGGPKAEEPKITQNLKEPIDKPKNEALGGNTGVGEPSEAMLMSKKEDKQKFEHNVEKKDEKVEPSEAEAALENKFKRSFESRKGEKGNENGDSKMENLKKAMKRLTSGGLKANRAYLVNVGVAAIIIVAFGVSISYSIRSCGCGEESKP